jgi:hypothetical protein
VLRSKKVIFKVSNKTKCDKKDIQRQPKCSRRSWSQSHNSDLLHCAAGAGRNIYRFATLVPPVHFYFYFERIRLGQKFPDIRLVIKKNQDLSDIPFSVRSLQKGTFDSKYGDYEWIISDKRHDMETSRKKFFL